MTNYEIDPVVIHLLFSGWVGTSVFIARAVWTSRKWGFTTLGTRVFGGSLGFFTAIFTVGLGDLQYEYFRKAFYEALVVDFHPGYLIVYPIVALISLAASFADRD